MLIVIRSDLGLSRGKLIAQGAHAAIGAYIVTLSASPLIPWAACGQRKIVASVDTEEDLLALEAAAKKAGLPHYLVRDYGLTEVGEGTVTALGIGPATDDDLDPLTGGLGLFK